MKKNHQTVCPGCGKHCPADAIRCKYGRAYFAQLASRETGAASSEGHSSHHGHKCKWEKDVAEGGLGWKFLSVGRGIKKALRSGTISEEHLLNVLSEAEKAQLSDILDKLSEALD